MIKTFFLKYFELFFWIAGLISLAISNPAKAPHFTLCPLKALGFKWCPGCNNASPYYYGQHKHSATIVTDDYKSYNGLNKVFQHATVDHSEKEYVNEMANTNGVENFWSHLKRGVDGIYHWVSTEHLHAYYKTKTT